MAVCVLLVRGSKDYWVLEWVFVTFMESKHKEWLIINGHVDQYLGIDSEQLKNRKNNLAK